MSITPQVFLTKDFIESILGTLLAFVLFLPLAAPGEISLDSTVVFALVLGYLMTQGVYRVHKLRLFRVVFEYVVCSLSWRDDQKTISFIESDFEWWSANWDYDRLWTVMSQDQRDSLLLEQSYAHFYLTTYYYALLYWLYNVIFLLLCVAAAGLASVQNYNNWYLLNARTSVVGGGSISTWLVAVLCPVLVAIAAVAYCDKRYQLQELYRLWATHFHSLQGGLAKALWGDVPLKSGQRVCGELDYVVIEDLEGGELMRTQVDPEGRFQFKDGFSRCLEVRAFVLKYGDARRMASCERTTVPEFRIFE